MSTAAAPRSRLARLDRLWAQMGSARYLVTHRRVLVRATRNEVSIRYAGSALGRAWVFVAPLLMLGIYSIVYLEIFRSRAPGLTKMEYVVYIFGGLVPFTVLVEGVTGSIGAVVSNKTVLSNTVFPIDLAPVKPVLISMATMVVGFAFAVAGTAATGNLGAPILFLPFVIAMQAMAVIGLGWILSLLNVVFRDLQNLVGVVTIMLLIASPIAYTPEMVPDNLKLFLDLNPFSYYISAYHKVTVLNEFPSPGLVLGLMAMSGTTFVLGSWFFHRAKGALIDHV